MSMKSKNMNYRFFVEYFDAESAEFPKPESSSGSVKSRKKQKSSEKPENPDKPLRLIPYKGDKWEKEDPEKDRLSEVMTQRTKEIAEFCFPVLSPTEEWEKILKNPAGERYLPHSLRFFSFRLKTTYPGLLMGTGLEHDMKIDGAVKCGFSFDYVTGLPYIPGSSLKGMLRSFFPGDEKPEEESAEYGKYILSCLSALIPGAEVSDSPDFLKLPEENGTHEEICEETAGTDTIVLQDLKNHIFENGDVFLGAFPVFTEKDDSRRLLDTEFITPHNRGRFKNPQPISLIKVRPDVVFEFCFLLRDYTGKPSETEPSETGNSEAECSEAQRSEMDRSAVENSEAKPKRVLLHAEKKAALFRQLILDMGVGAKTNVGFSRFAEEEKIKNDQETSEKKDMVKRGKKSFGIHNTEELKKLIQKLECEQHRCDE